MTEFGIRLDTVADPEEIARITGLPAATLRHEVERGVIAQGLSQRDAERMVANLSAAGIDATAERGAMDPLRTQEGFAAIAPPKVTQPLHGAPPRPTLDAPPPFPSASPPIDRRPPPLEGGPPPKSRISTPAPAAPPIRPARETRPLGRAEPASIPPRRASRTQPVPAPSPRTPWIIAGALIILSGALVAWAWRQRGAGLNALRQAEAAYAAKDYAAARRAAQRAAAAGADPWAARLLAAITAGPRVDAAETRLAQGDLQRAQQELIAARAIAPEDPRTLRLILRLREARTAVAAAPVSRTIPSTAPVRVAPASVASDSPPSQAPPSVADAPANTAPESTAPESTAPEGAAPESTAPESAAPPSAAKPAPPSVAPPSVAPPSVEAPASVAPPSVAKPPPSARSAQPPSAGAKDRSTVARLKIVSPIAGEVLVNGKGTRQTVPGWVEVRAGRHTLAIRTGDGRVVGERMVKVAAGRRATVRLREE